MGYPTEDPETNDAYIKPHCPRCRLSDCGWWLEGMECLNLLSAACLHDGGEFLSPIVNGPHAGAWLCADCCGHKRWAKKSDVRG